MAFYTPARICFQLLTIYYAVGLGKIKNSNSMRGRFRTRRNRDQATFQKLNRTLT